MLFGNTIIAQQANAAALALFNTQIRGLVQLELPISATKDTLDTASARQGIRSLGLTVVFTFGARAVEESITIPVNSLLFASGGEGGADITARNAAAAAARAAADNKSRLDSIPVYAAEMATWPPNVRKHSDFQRRFQSTLSGLRAALATDAGSTGTRFTNVFRIFTQLSDGTVIQLHTQGWSFTEDDRQTIEWEVSAAEFNQLGVSVSTNGVEIWGEFRAVYGGGINELRGRTNPEFIDFGEQDEWPATRGEVASTANAEIQKALAPYSTIELHPPGIADKTVPTSISATFVDKQTPKTVTGITLLVKGQQWALSAATPIGNIEAGVDEGGVLQFSIQQNVADQIGNSINNADESITFAFTFTYSDGTNEVHRVPFLVQNPAFQPPAAPTSGLSAAQVDARIQAPARAGNAARWDKAKLPADTVYSGNVVDQTARNSAAAAQATANSKQTAAQVDALINAVSGITGKVVTQVDNSREAGFQGLSVWYGTKAQYDAIASKDAATIYLYPDA